jgi:hypothetical protein
VARRTSIERSRTFTEKRPSCGRRFSAMSRPLISFRRVTSALATPRPSMVCSCSTPSMRWRTRSRPSPGSMCTSDARMFTASWKMFWMRRMTGASDDDSSIDSCMRSMSPERNSSRTSNAILAICSVRR